MTEYVALYIIIRNQKGTRIDEVFLKYPLTENEARELINEIKEFLAEKRNDNNPEAISTTPG